MRTSLIAAVVILAALAWFNPDMEAFKQFAGTYAEDLVLRETGDTALGRALAGIGGGLTGAVIDRVTERRNFVVASTYTIDVDGDEGDDAWRFLGIAGQFVELSRPASIAEER